MRTKGITRSLAEVGGWEWSVVQVLDGVVRLVGGEPLPVLAGELVLDVCGRHVHDLRYYLALTRALAL